MNDFSNRGTQLSLKHTFPMESIFEFLIYYITSAINTLAKNRQQSSNSGVFDPEIVRLVEFNDHLGF